MSHVIGLRKIERMALALGYHGERKQIYRIPRNLIMQVRRLARKGVPSQQIIDQLNLNVSVQPFLRECKRLEIKLYSKGGRRNKHET